MLLVCHTCWPVAELARLCSLNGFSVAASCSVPSMSAAAAARMSNPVRGTFWGCITACKQVNSILDIATFASVATTAQTAALPWPEFCPSLSTESQVSDQFCLMPLT